MHELFCKAGLKLEVSKISAWPNLLIKRCYVNSEFDDFSDRELMNFTSSLIASKKI